MSLVPSSPRKKAKILVVEDEKDLRDLMTLHLSREGFDVSMAEDGEKASLSLNQETFDLAVLDWMLPGISGLEICKQLNRTIPVLMVTARTDPSDIVLALEMGADDYVTKPFEIPVLLARVRALLRRSSAVKAPEESEHHEAGGLRMEVAEHRVWCNDVEVELTVSEFKLVRALLENRGRVLSRDRLIKLVQGENISVTYRAIDTHVFVLRKKLGPCADVIETIRGVGYRVKA